MKKGSIIQQFFYLVNSFSYSRTYTKIYQKEYKI